MISLVSHYSPPPAKMGLSRWGGRFSRSTHLCQPLFEKVHFHVPTNIRRSYSISNRSSTAFLRDQLASQIDKYVNFVSLSNQEKVSRVFVQGLMSALEKFEKSSTKMLTEEECWEMFKPSLEQMWRKFPCLSE